MCGICTIYEKNKDHRALVQEMCDILAHRGPDAASVHRNGDITLGHRRLSISMSNSVEERVPFLDLDLVKFGFSIPARLKMKGNRTKYLLRKAMAPYLTEKIRRKKKWGFTLAGGVNRAAIAFVCRRKVSEARRKERKFAFTPVFPSNQCNTGRTARPPGVLILILKNRIDHERYSTRVASGTTCR